MTADGASSVRQMAGRAYGCELAVLRRLDGRWNWVVTVAGERAATGTAGSLDAAREASRDAVARHARDDGAVQLPLL